MNTGIKNGKKVVLALGHCVMTAGVAGLLSRAEVAGLLVAQATGDWGATCAEDAAMNDEAVRTGEDRVVSVHETRVGKVFVITEWDRSVTTVLLPSEY
ncbi:MAG: hypothetical protein IKY92_01580 [Akkermansia sp.]|nr:hypothetical protein [Akkermansia sp.]